VKNRDIILGPQGEPLELRYSDDQPRDKDGKFTTGGGGEWDNAKAVGAARVAAYEELAEEHDDIKYDRMREGESHGDPEKYYERLAKWQQGKLELLLKKCESKVKGENPTLKTASAVLKDSKEEMSKFNYSDATRGQDRALYLMHSFILSMGGHKRSLDFRFDPDQPREADGKFGSGGGASYDPAIPAPDLERWQAGEHQSMQAEATIAMKAGNAGKDPLLNAIRGERFDGMIYRGLSLDKDDPLLQLKGGGHEVIQLEPSSFSFDREIADEFSTQTQMEGEIPVVIVCGPWGNGIVIGDRGDPAYGPKGYDQKEVITAGHFRVYEAKNKIGPNGKYRYISLRQEGIF
jgi:hypothetical protein